MIMDSSFNSALLKAIETADLQKVVSLLNAGADPNAVDEYNQTALRNAVDGADDDAEHSDIVRVLLEHGADVNKDTVLLSAAYHNYADTMRLLLAYGVDPNQKCDEGSALSYAEQYGYTEVADMLRAAGAQGY